MGLAPRFEARTLCWGWYPCWGGEQRFTCKQIGSFARAQELLKQGHSYLDRDGDGVACESLR